MKKWKSILSAALAGIMILSTVVSVGAANVAFTDISSHWAKSQINYLVSKDVLNGYKQNNGTYIFKPDGTVTRAEFIKMLDETFGLTATAPISYSDVKTSDWFHPYISKAAAQGYLLNYGTSISPNGQLTREEATTLLVRYLGLLGSAKADASSFADYNQISDHFRDPVMIAVKAGLINGYVEKGATYFRPQKTLTRAEALTILYRAAGAIYNTSAYSKDPAAPAENAVITRGGVTVSGLNLNGRVIVTEGVSGEPVVFTGTTINNTLAVRGASAVNFYSSTVSSVKVDSVAPEINITLNNNSKIQSITLDSKASLYIPSGCQVGELIVNSGAKDVRITGSGSITKVMVYDRGMISTIMPDEFYIADDLSANFASQVYSGSSADQASFSSVPYLSEKDAYYYLNFTPEVSGQVYYYYSSTNYIPASNEYREMYINASQGGSFSVSANKIYSEKTKDANLVKNYRYVVLQLETGERKYAPVMIENKPTSGTGFAVEPYFNGNAIAFTPEIAGTVYYYYSSEGEDISISQFLDRYNGAGKLRSSLKVNGGSSSISLSGSTLEDYPYVIIALQNANGQYYNPVVVSAGDNGFSEEPEITTVGNIAFKTSVAGTLYYYYTDDDTMPTPNDVADSWRVEFGNGSVDVYKNNSGSIKYDPDQADRYPYMVFCVCEDNKTYLTPYILNIDIDTGFAVEPYVSAGDEISFKPNYVGTVYWYLSKYSNAVSAEEFMTAYSTTSAARRGKVSVTTRNSYSSFEFDTSYTQQYPYVVIMLEDTNNTQYQPVIVDVKNTTNTGFTIDPYCDLNNKNVYFKTASDGRVYYYYSPASASYHETIDEFWASYERAGNSISGSYSVTDVLDYIPFGGIDTSRYPGIMILFSDTNNKDHYPVYVSLTRDGSTGTSTNGVTLQSVSNSTISLYIEADGILFYTEYTSQSDSGRTRTKEVKKGQTITLPHTGLYKYMEIELEGYEVLYVDLEQDYDRNESVEDGSTVNGYGFTSIDWNLDGGNVTFTGVATTDGYITFSISGMPGSEKTIPVRKGEEISYTFENFNMNDIYNSILGSILGERTISAQLTSSNGDVYERNSIRT